MIWILFVCVYVCADFGATLNHRHNTNQKTLIRATREAVCKYFYFILFCVWVRSIVRYASSVHRTWFFLVRQTFNSVQDHARKWQHIENIIIYHLHADRQTNNWINLHNSDTHTDMCEFITMPQVCDSLLLVFGKNGWSVRNYVNWDWPRTGRNLFACLFCHSHWYDLMNGFISGCIAFS